MSEDNAKGSTGGGCGGCCTVLLVVISLCLWGFLPLRYGYDADVLSSELRPFPEETSSILLSVPGRATEIFCQTNSQSSLSWATLPVVWWPNPPSRIYYQEEKWKISLQSDPVRHLTMLSNCSQPSNCSQWLNEMGEDASDVSTRIAVEDICMVRNLIPLRVLAVCGIVDATLLVLVCCCFCVFGIVGAIKGQ